MSDPVEAEASVCSECGETEGEGTDCWSCTGDWLEAGDAEDLRREAMQSGVLRAGELLDCADQLDAYAATEAAETLSLEQAAAASGYSVAHLRRLISRGVLDDVGTDGVVALRQQDLPYKARRQRHPLPLGVLSLPT